jgi:hypothetical protein
VNPFIKKQSKMSTTTITTTKIASSTTVTPKSVYQADGPPLLEQRFADLKREIIKPENERAVSESYERLKVALAEEAAKIHEKQQAAVPEIPWADVVANGALHSFPISSTNLMDCRRKNPR